MSVFIKENKNNPIDKIFLYLLFFVYFQRSLAFFTLHERLPRIVTEIIDNLSRFKDEIVAERGEVSILFSPIFGLLFMVRHFDTQAAREEVKTVIGNISELKYELQTDKEFKPFPEYTDELKKWNEFLRTLDTKNSYFSAVWLYGECYLYRRLKLIFEET